MQKTIFLFIFTFFLNNLLAQVFQLKDRVLTHFSSLQYGFLPVMSDQGFAYLLFDEEKENKDFIFLHIENDKYKTFKVKNAQMEGGGNWINSACLKDDKFYLYHANGELFIYNRNKKGDFRSFKKQKHLPQCKEIACINPNLLVLMSDYDFYTNKALYNNYFIHTYNPVKKELLYQLEIDVGKAILLSYYSRNRLISTLNNKIAFAHPTGGEVYVVDSALQVLQKFHITLEDTILESKIEQIFSDSILQTFRVYPKTKIALIDKHKLDEAEHIVKIFWIDDDIVGYAIANPKTIRNATYGFYSLSQQKEIYRVVENNENTCNLLNSRIQIHNYQIINENDYKKENKNEDLFYCFDIFDIVPFISTKTK